MNKQNKTKKIKIKTDTEKLMARENKTC